MRRRLLVLVTAWLLLAGCAVQSGSTFAEAREPSCRYQGREGTALMVLIAQAVPTASQLPCVELKPAGWTVSGVFVRNGRVRFDLNSDRVGLRAVQVVLQQFCTLGDVTRVPSDHPGTRRYQEVSSIEPGRRYRGAVHYLFPGGCVTYRLDFRSDEQARPLGEVTLALGFVSRDTLRQTIADFTDGEVPLDPPEAADR
ncbi:MAG TPA: hypothetical protein VG846_10365 [Actinomycetota bacterium]|nr:hypothetical protein [Actinomycetota bacterium]